MIVYHHTVAAAKPKEDMEDEDVGSYCCEAEIPEDRRPPDSSSELPAFLSKQQLFYLVIDFYGWEKQFLLAWLRFCLTHSNGRNSADVLAPSCFYLTNQIGLSPRSWGSWQEPETSSAFPTGLGFINGETYPQCWPSNRPRLYPADIGPKTLVEAFQWPKIARQNLNKILSNLAPGDPKPLVTTAKRLRVSSHFSGVCAQTRASQVLESNSLGNVTFEHVRGSFVYVMKVLLHICFFTRIHIFFHFAPYM